MPRSSPLAAKPACLRDATFDILFRMKIYVGVELCVPLPIGRLAGEMPTGPNELPITITHGNVVSHDRYPPAALH